MVSVFSSSVLVGHELEPKRDKARSIIRMIFIYFVFSFKAKLFFFAPVQEHVGESHGSGEQRALLISLHYSLSFMLFTEEHRSV